MRASECRTAFYVGVSLPGRPSQAPWVNKTKTPAAFDPGAADGALGLTWQHIFHHTLRLINLAAPRRAPESKGSGALVSVPLDTG